MDHLRSKSTILAALKAGLVISGDDWLLRTAYGELLATVEAREDRLFPLTAAGVDEALDWVRMPF